MPPDPICDTNKAPSTQTTHPIRRKTADAHTLPAFGSPVYDAWSKGRVVLCGDAATAFLPTAGVGASNAMRAAASLADEISRANAHSVPLALEPFEKRARKVIEQNQQDSRNVARLMFVKNSVLSWTRNVLLSIYPVERIIGDIIKSMKTPF